MCTCDLLSFQLTSDLVQVALVHNPTDPASPPLLATAVQAILSNLSPSKVWPLVTNLLDMEDPLEQVAILSLAAQSGVAESKMEELLADNAVSKLIQSHTTFSHRVLQLEPGQSALLSNGKVHVFEVFFCILIGHTCMWVSCLRDEALSILSSLSLPLSADRPPLLLRVIPPC